MITFTPKAVSKNLLAALPDRSRAILIGRYGLGKEGERRTLESIGQEYGITRERVRQIENHGLSALRTSEVYAEYAHALEELKGALERLGGIVAQETIAKEIPKSQGEENHVIFLLTLGNPFTYEKEDAYFAPRWYIDPQLADKVQQAITALSDTLRAEDLVSEEEFSNLFASHLKEAGVKNYSPEHANHWLVFAKRLNKNPLGEWGRSDSPHVRVKSMRDFAYLTLKRHGSPMHFTEVAKTIEELFGRSAHPATCHNELIKDSRFVLVGRGLYALSEWGYSPGVVRDVIRDILAKEGPLTREEIIERVKRERYVKDATIAVNLQDPLFAKTEDGRFSLAE